MKGLQIREHMLFKLQITLLFVVACGSLSAQDRIVSDAPSGKSERPRVDDAPPDDVLSPAEWERVDASVDRALRWLVAQQNPDGSFPSIDRGQPAVTSFCVLAFMAHGHLPGGGDFGQRLNRATDYTLSCQKQNGLVALLAPDEPRITPGGAMEAGEPAAYNHAIASLMLAEVYGMSQDRESKPLEAAITKSLAATLEMQRWPKQLPDDRGGWRYISDDGVHDSDLSITGWELMFLRSARNAGFTVPQEPIDNAIRYVRRTFSPQHGRFMYTTTRRGEASRGMAGAGILALAHAGFHNSVEAQTAGRWLLRNGFEEYNGNSGMNIDRYHYSLFNATQAMYQLGGNYWKEFFPRTVSTLLANQHPDGSWDAESLPRDQKFGNTYTTALVVLSLGAPNQFLPIFQR